MTNQDTDKNSAIDRALAAAAARKAARAAAFGEETATLTQDPDNQPLKAKLTDEQKTKLREEKEEKKRLAAEKRAQDRAEKQKQKEADKTTKTSSHMKKVDSARSKCPPLSTPAKEAYDVVAADDSLAVDDLNALAQHILVEARARATQRAMNSPQLPMGATVRITGGDFQYRDKVGEVVHTQRLRAKVKVKGITEPVYIYTGEAVEVDAQQ